MTRRSTWSTSIGVWTACAQRMRARTSSFPPPQWIWRHWTWTHCQHAKLWSRSAISVIHTLQPPPSSLNRSRHWAAAFLPRQHPALLLAPCPTSELALGPSGSGHPTEASSAAPSRPCPASLTSPHPPQASATVTIQTGAPPYEELQTKQDFQM